jgi:hypothetical protein
VRKDEPDNSSVQHESKKLLTPQKPAADLRRSSQIDRVAPQLVSTLLRQVGEARVRVSGTSMRPAIRPKDILFIRNINIAHVVVGDVVLVIREGRLFAHRVVERLQGLDGVSLITRGDAHSRTDPPVTAPLLLGRVEGLRRNGIEVPLGSVHRCIPGSVSVLLLQVIDSIRCWAKSVRSIVARELTHHVSNAQAPAKSESA